MSTIRIFISRYFMLSKKETNGFLIQTIFMVLFIFSPLLIKPLLSSTNSTLKEDLVLIEKLGLTIQKRQPLVEEFSQHDSVSPKQLAPSMFNPNSASFHQLRAAGIPDIVVKRMLSYRKKGGIFRIKFDIKKMHGLSDETFERIFPYIDLPATSSLQSVVSVRIGKGIVSPVSLDINLADSTQLESLRGIGPALAMRIINYRTKLGGFVAIEQLYEVYGLDSTEATQLFNQVFVSKSFAPIKLNVNAPTLPYHPYLPYKYAKLLLNYRKQHGNYTSLEQLKECKGIPEDTYLKLLPYLSLE